MFELAFTSTAVWSDDEVDLEAGGRSPVRERLPRDVVAVADQLVREIGFKGLAEVGGTRPELAALKRRRHADVEEVVLRRSDRLPLATRTPGGKLVHEKRVS
jgi:hypothetical protein